MNRTYRHTFSFNPHDNRGENLLLSTNFVYQDDKVIQFDQKLSLQSYCNSAHLTLCGAMFTPENLRKLANELDEARIVAQDYLKNQIKV